jgi:hypothetical protein
MIIKICGLREAEHAVTATELGADLLGFVFAASPRQITPALGPDHHPGIAGDCLQSRGVC